MIKSFFKYFILLDKLFKFKLDNYNISCDYINIMNFYYNCFFIKKNNEIIEYKI